MQDESQASIAVGSGLLSRRDAARFLTESGFPIAASSLSKLASTGCPAGPEYMIWRRKALYDSAKLLEWARAGLSKAATSTSQHDDNARRTAA
jgi:hypothetical protein